MTSRHDADELVPVELGNAGAMHLRDAFAGGLTLGRLVLESVDLDQGKCFSPLPKETRRERALDFASGGAVDLASASDFVASFVAALLSRHAHGVFVAENAMARCADPAFPDDPLERFCLDDEVYEYVHGHPRPECVLRAINLADAGYTLNAAAAVPARPMTLPQNRMRAERAVLIDIASHVVVLLARAYDGEGFVVWRRA